MKRTRKLAVSLTLAAAAALTLTTYSLAQGGPGPGPGPKRAAIADAGAGYRHACRHECEQCPAQQLRAIAEVKVENTKSGALLQFSAKDPTKVGELQKLAEELAAQLKAGFCPMMGTGGPPPGKPMGR